MEAHGILPGRIRRFFRTGASFGLPRADEAAPTEDRRDRPTTAPEAAGRLAPDRRWPLCLYLTIVKDLSLVRGFCAGWLESWEARAFFQRWVFSARKHNVFLTANGCARDPIHSRASHVFRNQS